MEPDDIYEGEDALSMNWNSCLEANKKLWFENYFKLDVDGRNDNMPLFRSLSLKETLMRAIEEGLEKMNQKLDGHAKEVHEMLNSYSKRLSITEMHVTSLMDWRAQLDKDGKEEGVEEEESDNDGEGEEAAHDGEEEVTENDGFGGAEEVEEAEKEAEKETEKEAEKRDEQEAEREDAEKEDAKKEEAEKAKGKIKGKGKGKAKTPMVKEKRVRKKPSRYISP